MALAQTWPADKRWGHLALSQVDKRLEALESGLQELAETAKPASGYGQAAAVHTFSPYFLQGGVPGGAGAAGQVRSYAARPPAPGPSKPTRTTRPQRGHRLLRARR